MSAGPRNGRIDTLRGVSIVLVLLHHFNIAYDLRGTWLAAALGWPLLHAVVRNGNYAVTMFFAVSGFLITDNAARRSDGLRNVRPLAFYRRRAARILPCVVLLVATVDLLAWTGIGIFGNHPEFGGPVAFWVVDLASLTFWMNVLMAHAGWLKYVLCVQWSLSVEEVFYLAFPVLCLLLRRERLLLLAWSAFIVAGPVWRATHQASEYTELNAYLACTDGIAFGCCAAVLRRRIAVPPWSRAPLVALVGGAMAWFYLSHWIGDTAVYGVTLMAAGTATILVLQDGLPARPASRALAPIRLCGRLSLELYLFHLVVLASLRVIRPPDTATAPARTGLLAIYLVCSVIVAHAIGRWYSEPLNRLLGGRAGRTTGLRAA